MQTPRIVSAPLISLLLAVAFGVHAPLAQEPLTDDSLFRDTELAEEEGAVFGRLRYVEGSGSLRSGDELYTDLLVNDPILPGDVLATGIDGRAEAQLADGSEVLLDYDSELILLSLSDRTNQIENTTILQLARGSLIIRADEMDTNQKRFQIDTDAASIFLLSDGLFRIDVRDDGATLVASRRGVAEVMARDVSTIVRSGERVAVRPGQIPGEPQVFNTRLSDDFDVWAKQREEALVRLARADETVPAGLPEPVQPYAGELSYYGNWYHNPSYGWVWRPVGLGVDWQPYLYGRWAYGRGGLMWVSYEPWGWAPFHYGRWEFLVGSGWVWIPGHIFSGAYVAWSVSPGGYFGWCPLGYYNYPVSFHFGAGRHRDPWVYVRGHHLYHHKVQSVAIRDKRVLREIEHRRVVVRGRPVVNPRRIQSAPALAEEFHRVAKAKPGLRLEEDSPRRRMPFHEVERQRQVRLNNRSIRGQNPAARSVGNGGAVRSTPAARRGNSNVPQRRRGPADVRKEQNRGRRDQSSDVRYDSTPRARRVPPGRVDTNPRNRSPRAQSPSKRKPPSQQTPPSVQRRGARPDRAIPRIFTRRPPRQQPVKPQVKPRDNRPAPKGARGKAVKPRNRPPRRPKPAPPPRRDSDRGKSDSSKGKKSEKKD